MALINCPKCGKEVSDTSNYCLNCGCPLQNTPVPTETPVITETVIKPGKKRNYKALIIAIAAAVLALVLAITIPLAIGEDDSDDSRSSSKARNLSDPFEKLYIGQAREGVRKAYGKPDRSKNEDPDNNYSWNIDDYYKVKFLGKTGSLSVWYDSNNLVTHAWFEYNYPTNRFDPDAGPSSDDRDEAQEYALDIIKYYTKKYGDPQAGYYNYEWELIDGTKIGLDFNLDPGSSYEPVIELYWG